MVLVTNERQLGLLTKREKLLPPFLRKKKNQLSHITDQLLVTTSLSPPDADEELKNQVLDIVAKMVDLNSIRVYLDDAKTVSALTPAAIRSSILLKSLS
jgi:septum formation topological specificity factor MinE